MEAGEGASSKAMFPPNYSKQKTGIFFQSLILVFLLIMIVLNNGFDSFFYLTLCLILALTRTSDLFNMFAVLKDGIIIGNRFVAWKKIKSFEWVPIDMNHKFYGYDPEANRGYELKMKRRFFSERLIVTTEEMKERLTALLNEQLRSVSPTR